MHGVEELSMTGARGSQVVNGSSAPGPGTPPAATQVGPTSVPLKSINKVGVNSSIITGSVNVCQQVQQQGAVIMSRPGVVTAATPNGTPVSLPLQPGMQIVNVRPNQGIQMASVRGLPPRMILNQLPGIRPGQPGQLTLQTLQGLPPGTQGHLIVKTDNGQLQLLRVNTAPPPGQLPPNGTQNTMVVHQTPNNTFRFHQPQAISNATGSISTLSNSTNIVSQAATAGGQTVVVPASVVTTTAVASTTTVAVPIAATTTATTSSQSAPLSAQQQQGTQTISADSAKTKCKNFLATLLRLAGEQRAKVAQNVRNLIQGLIDGKVEPEAFTEELQKDLNSAPQPCLIPFLKKTLPYLRASLARGELTIEGVKPPPLSAVVPVTGTTVIPSMNIVRQASPAISQVRLVAPAAANAGGTIVRHVAVPNATPTIVSNSSRVANQVQPVRISNKVLTAVKPPASATPASAISNSSNSSSATANNSSSNTSSARSSKGAAPKEDKKKDKSATFNSFSSSLADDDINDVAAMGGVNLGEESQRILDSTGFVGTQIRSCKDDTFLLQQPLMHRVRQICSEYGLEEPGKDVVSLISHATQERLKGLVEKLAVIAEHRLDILKMEPRYETVQDVKGQLRFLEELDKLEKKRKDEQEREMLLRAAKSRSKSEDPEQAKLKAKAKEMQRVEMEEMRQRDANLTALKALQGPKKKPKLDINSEENGTFSGTFTQKQIPLRPRIKRVNLRDLLFLMEQEKDLNKSTLLYRTHLK